MSETAREIACYLVIDGEPGAALPLTFDPNGPARGSDLPAQLACVAWPTDGWPVGPLPKGVDAARVAAVGEQAVGPDGGDSIVVIYGGKLVYENYADGVSADSVLPSFSMSKSFTSTMVGLLVDEGKLALDARAPIAAWAGPDDPRNAITLRNLLNMASGLQWYESYTEATSDVIKMVVSPDNAAYAIAKPLEVKPGTRFQYSTGDTMVLAKIIGDAAGVSGDAYAQYLRDRLLDPLGIVPAVPGIDPAGTWRGGYQTDTTTRNFAKLGLLYLRDGVWEDRQFLSPDWVDFVRTPGPSPGYGGQFWLNGDGSFSMIGLYGQSVQIVPQLDLIVAGNNGGGTGEMADLFRNAEKPTCGGTTAPAAADDDASVTALKTVDVDVLANDSGGTAGLAAATLTVADPPVHGTADIVDGRIRYRAESAFTGTDSFRYVVCTTDRRDCVEAGVDIEVRPLVSSSAHRSKPVSTPGHPDGPTTSRSVRRPDSPRSRTLPRSPSTARCRRARRPRTGRSRPPARTNCGAVWFWWSTNAAWTGCRDLHIMLADGETHAAHFAWRAWRHDPRNGAPRTGPRRVPCADRCRVARSRRVSALSGPGVWSRSSARTSRARPRGASAHPSCAAAVARADAVVVAGRWPRRSGRDRPLRHRGARGVRGDGVGPPRRLAGCRTPDVGARSGRAGAGRHRRRSARACRPPLRSRDRTAGRDRRGVRTRGWLRWLSLDDAIALAAEDNLRTTLERVGELFASV